MNETENCSEIVFGHTDAFTTFFHFVGAVRNDGVITQQQPQQKPTITT